MGIDTVMKGRLGRHPANALGPKDLPVSATAFPATLGVISGDFVMLQAQTGPRTVLGRCYREIAMMKIFFDKTLCESDQDDIDSQTMIWCRIAAPGHLLPVASSR